MPHAFALTPETKTGLELVRRTATGVCASPQGIDGVPELARTAYEALLAAEWAESEEAPSMPVHDFDRPQPSGDAYKAVFGYESAARTERASCGAVCYSYAVPADALSGEPCDVEAVSVRVIGDRYLAQGAVLRVVCPADPAPPPVAAFLSLGTASDPLCATAGQTDAKGDPIPPNKRTGLRVDASVELPEGTAAPAYVHVGLFLADYLTARGAGIEGGAMVAPATLSVRFSRAVEGDHSAPAAEVLEQAALNAGIFASSSNALTLLQKAPAVSLHATYSVALASAVFDSLADTSFESRVRNVLALAQALPDLYSASSDNSYRHGTEAYAVAGAQIAVETDGIKAAAIAFSGKTGNGVFHRLRLTNALDTSIPFRLVAFGIPGPVCIAATAGSGSATTPCHVGTPVLSYRTLLDKSFLAGKAASVLSLSSLGSSASADFDKEGATVSVPGVTLAAIDCPDGRFQSVDFDRPFESGWVSTVLLAFIPNGAPLSGASADPSVSLTVQCSTAINGDFGSSWNQDAANARYAWDSPPSGSSVQIWGNFHLTFSATIDGKSFRAGVTLEAPDGLRATVTRDSTYYTPPGGTEAWGKTKSQRATLAFTFPRTTGSVLMKAGDGTEVRVQYVIPAKSVTRHAWAVSHFNFGKIECNDEDIGALPATGTRSVSYATATLAPGHPVLERISAT